MIQGTKSREPQLSRRPVACLITGPFANTQGDDVGGGRRLAVAYSSKVVPMCGSHCY